MADMETKVLVLGASGMLGNAMLRVFAQSEGYAAWGSVRSKNTARLLPRALKDRVTCGVDAENVDALSRLFAQVRPDVVINCIGVVKQLRSSEDPLVAIPVNALLPHRLSRLCQVAAARFVHVSTDCVFAGTKGMYREQDEADAQDLYGRSKHMGEVDYVNAVTLRTSIIGHEVEGTNGLIDWFLSQNGPVKGYTRAIFSGLPTVELARLIRDYVLPRPELHGVYHVSAAPISKYELLRLVAKLYERTNEIAPDDKVVVDRSLDSTRFRQLTGYVPAPWPELVRRMLEFAQLNSL
jgi:dTDP-4-dehydrorhamnose reductase